MGRDFVSNNTAQQRGVREPLDGLRVRRHVSVDKAFDMVGIGRENVRFLPTDAGFRVRLDALESAIDSDKKRGFRPAVLVANAGSTATGSIDPLPELASIARRESMWLHADAAYGGGVLLSKKRAGALAGIEQAHSVHDGPSQMVLRSARMRAPCLSARSGS